MMIDNSTALGGGDGAAIDAGERGGARVRDQDQRMRYAELTRKQPNTVRTEPGARLDDLTREGTRMAGMMVEDQRPGQAQAPAERGTYANKFTTEGARIHGTCDGLDWPGESRPASWRPDETKVIDTSRDLDAGDVT